MGLPLSVMIEKFREYSFLLLRYHSLCVGSPAGGEAPRFSGYADWNMGLSEAK
jgi:hypothetical protein